MSALNSLILVEIGRLFEGDFQRLVVADEISPDSCRLWDIKSGKKLDKDVFRRDLGSLTVLLRLLTGWVYFKNQHLK